MPIQIGKHQAFTLLEVMNSVKKTIEKRYTSSFWAIAEIGKLNYYPKSGHCYPDLFYNENGETKAIIRSVIWKKDFIRIREKFSSQLGININDGMKILFETKIDFSQRHGLTLIITDVDVSFAMGELAMQKLETLQRIKDEGIADFNKNLKLPTLIKKIAIISVQTSKGFSDFRNIVDNNKYKLAFAIKLFPATMQGENAAQEISKIIEKISLKPHIFDCIMIIRGGGGEDGLMCYNSYLLGSAIAKCKIPVLTGIGHSTNATVAEQMANISFATPSDLANALINHNKKALDFVNQTSRKICFKFNELYNKKYNNFYNLTRIIKIATSKNFDITNQKFNYVYKKTLNNLKSFVPQKQEKFNLLIDLTKLNLKNFIKSKEQKFYSSTEILTSELKTKISLKTSELQNCQEVINANNPQKMFSKGYSHTSINGKTVYSASQLKFGDKIITTLADGEIVSVVE